jgi:hypothetical protein
MLPDGVALMLTAEMTGCTFGMATYPDGGVEICHANYQHDTLGLDKDLLAKATGWCPIRFDDHRYRETIQGQAVPDIARQARMGATIVGVRSLKRWTVYAQQWENLDGTNFEFLDLIKL